MSVYRIKLRGFTHLGFGGGAETAITRAKYRRQVGRVIGANTAPRKKRVPQLGGHGLPRVHTAGAAVDAVTMRAIKSEAKKRHLRVGALLGLLIEAVCEDGLWDAVLGDKP